MTNRKAINFVLENYDVPADVREKFEGMLAALDRKATADRKPTAKQVENEGIREALVAFINANAGETENGGFTVTELIKSVDVIADASNQKVSAILRQAILNGEIAKTSVKRHTYFCPVQE
jgi:hypothetical protein